MTNQAEPLTKTHRGTEYLAKLYKGEPSLVTYANRTQAYAKLAALGAGWEVVQHGRPWFVRKIAA